MDIHEFDRRLKWAERSIKSYFGKKLELITKFSRSREISGLSKARIEPDRVLELIYKSRFSV